MRTASPLFIISQKKFLRLDDLFPLLLRPARRRTPLPHFLSRQQTDRQKDTVPRARRSFVWYPVDAAQKHVSLVVVWCYVLGIERKNVSLFWFQSKKKKGRVLPI